MTDSQINNLPSNSSRLHRLMIDAFNLEELRTLCFDLNIRFDNLGGEGVSAKARELLLNLDRTKRIAALLDRLEELRPHVDWRGGPAADVECPYKGLHAFREEDADNFFGRETFTATLVKKVQQQSLVAVVGSSGSGKSSVVYAGLLPKLRHTGRTRLRQLSQRISAISTVSSVDTMAVLEGLLTVLPEELANGNIVELGDFGSFWLRIKTTGEGEETAVNGTNITGVLLRFTPVKS